MGSTSVTSSPEPPGPRVRPTLAGSITAWRHLSARALTSQIVCRVLFGPWRICACGRCLNEDGDR